MSLKKYDGQTNKVVGQWQYCFCSLNSYSTGASSELTIVVFSSMVELVNTQTNILHPCGPLQAVLRCMVCLLLFWITSGVSAQTLEGVDDDYGIPFGQTLQVEALGVLENDTLDGEPAGENGALAELLSSTSSGTLICPADLALELCADGSF